MIPFEQIESAALANLGRLLEKWFPSGRWRGHEYVVGDIEGNPGESFSINSRDARFAEFNGRGIKGRGAINLCAAKFHGGDRTAAAKELGSEFGLYPNGSARQETPPPTPADREKPPEIWEPQLPPPCEPPELDRAPKWHGRSATLRSVYRDASGVPQFVVYRYPNPDKEGAKEDIPCSYGRRVWTDPAGKRRDRVGWHFKRPPVPLPLYRLDKLDKTLPVMVVEGERKADAAARLFPGWSIVTSQGGSGSARFADWGAISGLLTTIWPDHDAAGMTYARDVAAILGPHNVRCVQIPDDWPDGWDLADEPPDGADLEEMLCAATPMHQEKTNGTGHHAANGFDIGAEDVWGGWPGPDPDEMHAREGAEPEPDPEPPPPSFWDPFDEPKPPEFPRGVLSWGMEQTVFALAKRDGVDPGAQAMAYLAAGSGAAHKAARFFPYANSDWGVPAILWVMLLALSGQRKTPVINNAFNPLRARDREAWAEYSKQKKAWEALPKDEQKKTPEPEEPHTVCVGDVTIEKLQIDLARSGRGAILVRDELADLLGFGAYSPAHAAKERAYYLQAYEGGTYHVGRVGRGTVFIEENALSLYGAIPPARLADFKDLDSDGFMQRMCVVRAAESASADPDVKVEHRLEIDGALSRLTQQTFGRQYFTEGGELIRETEQFGVKLASISDYGLGFQGFCSKLHGLHARLALVLHLLDNPDETMVPVETVMRAKRLLREYLLPQTLDFYSSFSKSGINRQRDVASWILTRAKDRFVASDLTAAMKWCRNLTTKQMNEMLEPLVNGGWLTPEEPWPQINRGWKVTPGLGQAFAERASTETRRRAEVRDLIARAKGSQ